jgi:Icc-related predicted phosphoesterase
VRVHVVSDVHGDAAALARSGDGADALVCLGDLLLFVDYADHGAGILGELFGAEAVGRYVGLRTARRYDEAREFSRSLWAREGVRILDGEVVELGGWRFGFVGGGLPSPMRTPYEVPEEEYAAKVDALGEVDVLCTHIPPALPELLYDVVARRFERGSEALLETIKKTQPRYALFGHVHQPLQRRIRIGRTECVNVGHFRGTGRPWVLSWER